MTDLTTTYLGLRLRAPLVASSSPLTGDPEALLALDEAGVGAVVLPSLFEEQVVHEALEVDRMLATGAGSSGEAAGYFPELDDYNTGPDHYLARLEQARDRLSVPVIASLNALHAGSWVRYARLLAGAGADALELNVPIVATPDDGDGAVVERGLLDTVAAVVAAVGIPVAVKLGPFWSSLPDLARRLDEVGAAALVLFNRPFAPDLDPRTRTPIPTVTLTGPDDLFLPLRWVALLEGTVGLDLAVSSGVHDGAGLAKALLAGATVAMTASAVLRHGPARVGRLLADLRTWMAEEGYESVAQLRGSASAQSVADPSAYLRSNYLQALTSYSSSFPA